MTPDKLKEHTGETAEVTFFMEGIGNTVFDQGAEITAEGGFAMKEATRAQVRALILDPDAPPHHTITYRFRGEEYPSRIAGY